MNKKLYLRNLTTLLLVITFTFSGIAIGQTSTKSKSPARRSADSITAKQLREYLYFVASDAMGGRDTPSTGLDLTAQFIGLMLTRWGFKPAGDDETFFQKMALTANNTNIEKTTLKIGGEKLKYGRDFFSSPATASAEGSKIVFGGNGWFIKQKNIDAFAGIDVKDKVVVLYSEAEMPEGVSMEELRSGKLGRFGSDIIPPQQYAASKGAVGIIVVATDDTENRWDLFRERGGKGRFAVDKFAGANPRRGGRSLPTITISKDTAAKLFKDEEKSASEIGNASSFELKKTTSFSIETEPQTSMTQNVVAIWEGSDPALKNEMVAIGAHYDHVGTNPLTKGDDKIFNGADDDGSGTVAVLSIAEALAGAKKRPKRSILFVWHAGEEKGLLGSRYFNNFPTVNIKNVVAQLNIDMIGRSRKPDDIDPRNKELSTENEVYVIGSNMMSSKLGEVTKSINDSYLKLNYDLRYDDPKDPNQFFFRSDHFNYAINGIPIVFWFDGVHEDYHQAGDEPQKIDYQKMEKIARTIYLTMWEVADLKERPSVDKELPKELTQRQ